MTFLGPKVYGNFKPPRNPNKPRKQSASTKRPCMSAEYLAKIRQLPSCISWGSPVEAHHLRIKAERGVGQKATDKWALPLTMEEHRAVHRVGSRKEAAWFSDRGIDCYALASALWANNHDLAAMYQVLLAHFHNPGKIMTDLELIEKHMAERFATPDPFVKKRIEFLILENEHLMHRVMCLQAENRGLRGIIELLRNECGAAR